ncbi:hypothetical protein IA01_02145 [Flavobacterium psychrophilum]|uniref:Hypothetical transmembrane protein n=7 Tax=Flavobacterium psychrophilum TaxID=96345 RepID=A6GWR3_FLAPJ|nr:hypothetical protein [Flavobacterium psychrophilum]AIG29341.1 hypothetical protein IA03_02095 [Flavobacterium psychrophilum]AIG31618.1 hypothetical protein IA01_02145 [Flavobacterium psychrophilum]AIG33772.1 hypothetical protein IA02_01500 [Flavobacterium psychrophilum]AIG36134.1 hypothetical protein IA04_02035 [Flavobacterium psychrophilum]AIG38400.1 hypothetical protein IA05_02090 [Flavobacterium psychrophilum]
MKKIIFKSWIINLVISISLFVIYRLIIAETNYLESMSMFEKFLFFIDVLLNIWVSILSLIAMFFCSLFFFLNLVVNIRNNYYLSSLSFLGIPTIWIIYLIVINIYTGFGFYRTILVLSMIYLFLTAVQFLKFRKKIKSYALYK